jgi:hypothetical protein
MSKRSRNVPAITPKVSTARVIDDDLGPSSSDPALQIASLVNTYDIMNSHNVVFVGNAHEVVTELLKK